MENVTEEERSTARTAVPNANPTRTMRIISLLPYPGFPLQMQGHSQVYLNQLRPKKRLNASVPGAAAFKANLVRHDDSSKIFGVLIAKVSAEAQANRGAVIGRQCLTIHAVG